VYLFHFPIEQTIAHLFPGLGHWWAMALAASLPTALCAGLSWTLIERPILRRKARILSAADRAYVVVRNWRRAGRRRRLCPAMGAARTAPWTAPHRG
jgi:peptidoglycan/LPS O-acetylase OafA/YrhL